MTKRLPQWRWSVTKFSPIDFTTAYQNNSTMPTNIRQHVFESTVCDKQHLWKKGQDFCPEGKKERKKERKKEGEKERKLESKQLECLHTLKRTSRHKSALIRTVEEGHKNRAAHNSAGWQETLFHDYFRF